MSKIEWTEKTWNWATGCSKCSAGCLHCYAALMARRLKAMGQAKYANGFKLTIHDDLLVQLLEWRKPKRIFVNSMSDTFHRDIPEECICKCLRYNEPRSLASVPGAHKTV